MDTSPLAPDARAALQLAEQLSTAQGQNQVNTEHLILGILAQPGSRAYRTLVQLRLDPTDLERKLSANPTIERAPTDCTPEWSESLALAMRIATEESRAQGQEIAGSEHMLLGVVLGDGGLAGRVLREMGVEPLACMRAIIAVLHQGVEQPDDAFSRLTQRSRATITLARDEAVSLGADYIGTEHLLLGILRQPNSVAARTLRTIGLQIDVLHTRMLIRGILAERAEQSGDIRVSDPAQRLPSTHSRESQSTPSRTGACD